MPRRGKEWVDKQATALLLMSDEDRIEMIRKMLELLDYEHEKVGLVLFYLLGLRPEEALNLTKDNFKVAENTLIITLPTAKHGRIRQIELDINETPFVKDIIIPYINKLEKGQRLWPTTWSDPTNFNKQIFEKIKIRSHGEYDFTPYVFREFRLTYLATLGVDVTVLQSWKGAADIRSIMPYLISRPVREVKKAIR